MQTAYRIPNRPVAPGTIVDPKDTIPYTALDVKSIFTSPLDGATVPIGSSIQLRGFAWAGEAAIARVDVSADAGQTGNIAVLDNAKARYNWRGVRHLRDV